MRLLQNCATNTTSATILRTPLTTTNGTASRFERRTARTMCAPAKTTSGNDRESPTRIQALRLDRLSAPAGRNAASGNCGNGQNQQSQGEGDGIDRLHSKQYAHITRVSA